MVVERRPGKFDKRFPRGRKGGNMSAREIKATVRRIVEEVWNEGNLSAIDKYLPRDSVDVYLGDLAEQQASTRQGVSPEAIEEHVAAIKERVAAFRSAFPDIQVTIETDDVITEGDKAAFRATWSGTHQGEFMNISPTGGSIAITGIGFLRLDDSRIVDSSMNISLEQGEANFLDLGLDLFLLAWPPRWRRH
jgi:predicted ester cyclase